jgi:K+-transporting ATPase KdpF subunit
MSAVDVIGALVVVGLLIYLVIALVRAEEF